MNHLLDELILMAWNFLLDCLPCKTSETDEAVRSQLDKKRETWIRKYLKSNRHQASFYLLARLNYVFFHLLRPGYRLRSISRSNHIGFQFRRFFLHSSRRLFGSAQENIVPNFTLMFHSHRCVAWPGNPSIQVHVVLCVTIANNHFFTSHCARRKRFFIQPPEKITRFRALRAIVGSAASFHIPDAIPFTWNTIFRSS